MIFELLVVFFLLLLNAFFAMSEMALVSASKPMLRQMAKQGNKRAAIALSLTEDSGKFLSTVQIGITLVGIAAGAYGGATIAEKLVVPFNEIGFINPHGDVVAMVIVVTLLTYFSVVVGELIPKQLALSNSEKIAMFVARPMKLLSTLCAPAGKLLDVSAAAAMHLLGAVRNSDSSVTEAEVKAVIAEGAESGVLEKTEHEMLQRIIRLDDRDVKSIMTHRLEVTFMDVNEPIAEFRKKVHEAGHSRYPVIDADHNKVLGVVHAKDLLDSALSQENVSISTLLKPIQILPENTSCLKALELFKNENLHLAVVVDEYGSTVGVITASDLLEAIVGVMPSNYDEDEQAQIFVREDGSWLVDGLTPIEEIHISIGEEIEADPSYDTIAGYLINLLGKTPKEGDVAEHKGYRFEVLDMDGRRVDKILVTRLDGKEDPEFAV